MAAKGPSPGEQLVGAGWKQGALLPSTAPVLFHEWAPGTPPVWVERRRGVTGELVVASQTCDLKKDPGDEPLVECLRAFWTSNPKIVVPASKNAIRHFFLRERRLGEERQGLVAEAASRVFIEKRSLLNFTPEPGCADATVEARFRRWLGRRYDRPAVPDSLVRAAQKPVVDALRRLADDDRTWSLLEGVREVLYDSEQLAAPFKVKLVFLREDRLTDAAALGAADAEVLAAWFIGVIGAAREAEVDDWDIVDTQKISIRDYLTLIPMPLDEYSL